MEEHGDIIFIAWASTDPCTCACVLYLFYLALHFHLQLIVSAGTAIIGAHNKQHPVDSKSVIQLTTLT